ncbi:hypothetical protein DM02DRAFT_653739 [Periconia macrospinosa]|uniref:Rhodopsin domain-containing protein n=1 Tax=Periconia macrospinosa TaxID=97972 RepID=A0A2V1DY71_9PLEO|nr:hypothetical protein DM02DRAFT_653739 [Periconia macrospinosa]
MADATSPGSDVDRAWHILVPCGILLGLSLPIYTTRMYSRIHLVSTFGWADYTATLSETMAVIWYALTVAAAYHGLGHHVNYVSTQDRAYIIRVLFFTNLLWLWTTNLLRISTALLLLQLNKDSRWWKRVLQTTIVAQIVFMVGATTVQLTVCRPLRVQLGYPVSEPKCFPVFAIHIYGYTYNIYNVLCDLLFSIMPAALIWQLHRPKSEKILICCLMATWLIASSMAIVKMVTVMGGNPYSTDTAYDNLRMNLYFGIEILLGTLAASLPCLKAPIRKVLQHVGILRRQNDPTASSNGFKNFANASHIARQLREIALQTLSRSFSRTTAKRPTHIRQSDSKKQPQSTVVTLEDELSRRTGVAQKTRDMKLSTLDDAVRSAAPPAFASLLDIIGYLNSHRNLATLEARFSVDA